MSSTSFVAAALSLSLCACRTTETAQAATGLFQDAGLDAGGQLGGPGISALQDAATDCNHDGICQKGEAPTCTDCILVGGCNSDGVCESDEDPSCADCTAPCNGDGSCDPDEGPTCADCIQVVTGPDAGTFDGGF